MTNPECPKCKKRLLGLWVRNPVYERLQEYYLCAVCEVFIKVKLEILKK